MQRDTASAEASLIGRRSAVLLASGLAGAAISGGARAEGNGKGSSLDDMLRPYLTRFGLPAISAAVVRQGKLLAFGAVGTRRFGYDIPITIHDRFHIGSDTKAMTVVLAAQFIEQGKLRWDTRLEEVFTELQPRMDPGFRAITLTQLMSHTSGLPSDSDAVEETFRKAAAIDRGNLDVQRRSVVEQWAGKPLVGKPNETWAYSNLGYIVLGAVLERVGASTWEEMVATRIFDPLRLRTAGFGPQSTPGRVDAALPHDMVDGKPFAYLAGPNADNPPLMGPAGTVHMSVLDFAAWANWQTGEGRRGPALVSAAALRRMHTRVIDMPPQPGAATGTPGSVQASDMGYGLGWGMLRLSYLKDPFIFHGGSNEKNYALICLQPQHDFAMVMMTNIGGPKGDEAFKGLGTELYGRFMDRASSPRRT